MKSRRRGRCSIPVVLVSTVFTTVALRALDPIHRPSSFLDHQGSIPRLTEGTFASNLSELHTIRDIHGQLDKLLDVEELSGSKSDGAANRTSAPEAMPHDPPAEAANVSVDSDSSQASRELLATQPIHSMTTRQPSAGAEETSKNKVDPIGDSIAHRDILLEIFPGSELGITVCRIYNVCRSSTGVLTIRDAPGSILPVAALKCHGRKSYFTKNSGRAKVAAGKETVTEVDADLFLAGTAERSTAVRYHMPHAMSDIIADLAGWDLMQYFYTRLLAKDLKPGDLPGLLQYNKQGRTNSEFKVNGLKGQAIFESRLAATGWIPSLLERTPHFDRSIRIRDLPENDVCFRSAIVATPDLTLGQQSSPIFSVNKQQSAFAMKNSLSRRLPERSSMSSCDLNVLIINRPEVGAGRSLTNAKDLLSSIQNVPGASLRTQMAYFHNVSFDDQVKSMQKADIIVSVHGAELTNLIFARVGTFVIEVCPYAYCPGPFDAFANIFGVNYTRITAKADVEAFTSCVERQNYSRREGAQKLINEFTQHAQEATQSGRMENFSLDGPDLYGTSGQRACARSQNLEVPVARIVADIDKHSRTLCSSQGSG